MGAHTTALDEWPQCRLGSASTPRQVAPPSAPASGARRREMRFDASRVIPARPRAPTIPIVFFIASISFHQRRLPLRAMRDAARDRGKILVQSVPEHLEAGLLQAAVRLLVVERIDLVALARTPEQLRVFF